MIAMRETRILEFKETITNTFLKTVSAFSNYNGGMILFGVAIISFPSLNGYIICLNTRKINRNFLRLIFQLILSVFFCYSSSFPVIAQNLH